MKLNEIIWTKKMRSVMKDEAQVLFLTGATGCSKTLVAGHKFMDWLVEAPEDDTQFFIIFKDRGTGVRNILQNQDSFYNMYDFMREPYSGGRDGGLQFIFHGLHGDKIVYLLGADDRAAWSKILGSNPNGIWLEELSVLHIDCIRECMGRAFSRGCKLIGTTNGGLPTQEFYTDFLNHAQVQFRDTVPSIELAEMVEDKPYMHYYHFNLNDDAPHLTETQRERLSELYPENSFYYTSKILGCRGAVEGAAYAPLMDKSVHIIPFEKIEIGNLQEIGLFVDVGSNISPDDMDKASTVATLIGYSKGCQRVIALESWVIPATSHDAIISAAEREIEPWWCKWMFKFKKIVIDSAEAILINTWKSRNKFNTIQVKGSVKGYKDVISLRTRCELKQQLLMQGRLLWSSHAIHSYNAHTRILLDDDGAELDMGVQDNDFGDSLAYGLTEKWNDITKNIRRG